jgi:hypothetical protein
MSDAKGGWNIPPNFKEQYNRQSYLTNFPHEGRLERVLGALLEKSENHPDDLVSINALDHKGKLVRFWMDVPNAMYLMNLLYNVKQQTNANVPTEPPPPTKPHPFS